MDIIDKQKLDLFIKKEGGAKTQGAIDKKKEVKESSKPKGKKKVNAIAPGLEVTTQGQVITTTEPVLAGCSSEYNSTPVSVDVNNSIVVFMTECERTMLGLDLPELPSLQITPELRDILFSTLTPVERNALKSIIHGIKGTISIVKVRRIAYETLVRTLFLVGNGTSIKQGLSPGIYYYSPVKSGKVLTEIIIKIPAIARRQIQPLEVPICEIGNIFIGANENEKEEQLGGALNRNLLNDSTIEMLDLDIYILKIIIYLFYFVRTQTEQLTDKAIRALYSFMISSSSKEYLDVGQLFAIVQPTNNGNNHRGFGHRVIFDRAMQIIQSVDPILGTPTAEESAFRFDSNALYEKFNIYYPETESEEEILLPRQPILETGDGAATRIAANEYFMSYTSCVLNPGTTDSLETTFLIDKKYVFYLCLLTLENKNIIKLLNKFAEQPSINLTALKHIIAIRNIIQIFINKKTVLRTRFERKGIIDLLYWILCDRDKIVILQRLQNYLSVPTNQPHQITTISQNVFLIDKDFYYLASVSCYLWFSNNTGLPDNPTNAVILDGNRIPNRNNGNNNISMKQGLIDCNFDSLCHDNGHSIYYRLVMIIMFILKNRNNDIGASLNEMRFTIPAAIGTTEITALTTEYGADIVDNFILPILFPMMNDDEQKIFYVLAINDYQAIEAGLYVRLKQKSCYAFRILDQDKYAIVMLENSAHNAITTVRRSSTFIPNQWIPASQIHSGILVLENVNVAVDLPLKKDKTLTKINGLPYLNSNVIVNSVTTNDAASQSMNYSLIFPDQICIPINVYNLVPKIRTFIYQYRMGNDRTENIENLENTCPDSIIEGSPEEERAQNCANYISIKNDFDTTNFYYRRSPQPNVKLTVYNYLQTNLLPYLLRRFSPVTALPGRGNPVREAFSKLIEKAICGSKPVSGNCETKRASEKDIIEAKTDFLNFLLDYINDPAIDINDKNLILLELQKIIRLTSFDNLLELNDYINLITPPTIGGESASLKPMSVSKLNIELEQNKILSRENKFDLSENKKSINGINAEIVSKAKGEARGKTQEPEMQSGYTTLFGKYGFEMRINSKGSYELIILNTQEEYDEYLKRYNLPNEPISATPVAPVTSSGTGGRIKTRKQKHGTRKGYRRGPTNKRYSRKKRNNKRKTRRH